MQRLLVLWLFMLYCGLLWAAPPAPAAAPVFPLLAPGISYQVERDGHHPWLFFVL